jgi:membrane-bound serine protease (ClpP class)
MLSMGEVLMEFDPVPTAAYIRPQGAGGGAWSAGVYLAISCKRLFMHPGTVIGAATPVQQSGEETPEKYVSAFREKFRARADQNGYPGTLAAAMVDRDLEVFEARVEEGRRYLTRSEAEQLQSQGRRVVLPEEPYCPKGKLLTLTDRQAADAGMAQIAANRSELCSQAGLPSAIQSVLEPSWSESLAGILTTAVASTVLLAAGLLGLWIEMKTPGFGIPGVLGVLALALLFFGHHLAGLAEAPEILLFVVGVGLVAAEIFLWPGTLISAIAGIVCILAGLVLSFQPFSWPDPELAPWEVDILLSSVGRIAVALALSGAGMGLLLRFLPKLPVLRRLILQSELQGHSPFEEGGEGLVGVRGSAVTPLRPGGKADLAGRVVDVVTEGEYVPRGGQVEVIRVEGVRVVVARR